MTLTCSCRVDERSNLTPSAKQIYLINCLAAMAAALAGRACCAGRAAALAAAAEAHMARLVGGEAGALLARCGLAEIADRVRCDPCLFPPGFLGFSLILYVGEAVALRPGQIFRPRAVRFLLCQVFFLFRLPCFCM